MQTNDNSSDMYGHNHNNNNSNSNSNTNTNTNSNNKNDNNNNNANNNNFQTNDISVVGKRRAGRADRERGQYEVMRQYRGEFMHQARAAEVARSPNGKRPRHDEVKNAARRLARAYWSNLTLDEQMALAASWVPPQKVGSPSRQVGGEWAPATRTSHVVD